MGIYPVIGDETDITQLGQVRLAIQRIQPAETCDSHAVHAATRSARANKVLPPRWNRNLPIGGEVL
jgi:hypothetical protein